MIEKVIEQLKNNNYKILKSINQNNTICIYKNTFEQLIYIELNSCEYKRYKNYKDFEKVVMYFLDKEEYCWVDMTTNKMSSTIDSNNHEDFFYLFYKRKVIRPSKEDLEKLIWENPTIKLAKKFGVSDKAIERWCIGYNIKKPPRGYWTKINNKKD